MKKIILFLLFICTFTHSSDLSTAIRESDLASVTTLLKQHSLTEKEKLKFLDIANKVIDLRRDQMAYAQMKGFGYQQELNAFMAPGVLLIITSIFAGTFAGATFYDKELLKYRYPLLSLAAITLFPGIFFSIKGVKKVNEFIESFPKNYNNALQIKEALLDLLEN